MAHHDETDTTYAERAARRQALAPGAQAGIDEALIERVVRGFYGRIRADAKLGPIFAAEIGSDWEPHLKKMMDFWSSVLLMTGHYAGRPMPAHIRLDGSAGNGKGLDAGDFQHWLTLFEATLRELCPGEPEALFLDRARRIAESFKLGIQFHRGQTPDWLGPVRSEPVRSV